MSSPAAGEASEAGTEQEELLQFPGKSLRLLGPKRRTLLFFDTIAVVSWEAPWQFPEQSLGGRRALALRMQTSNVSVYFMTSYLSQRRLRGRCYFVRLLVLIGLWELGQNKKQFRDRNGHKAGFC